MALAARSRFLPTRPSNFSSLRALPRDYKFIGPLRRTRVLSINETSFPQQGYTWFRGTKLHACPDRKSILE